MQTNELIDAIRGLLDGRPSSEAPEVLALGYAKRCREVNERLSKIGMMLEGGGEIQALQLAEQPPRVVDAALALSFGGESAWHEYCLNHGHEVAPLVDARTLEALLSIQGKGLSPNHPLYKDYRTAVSSRDDIRAHDLIRVIARMNPGDENAAKELKRLQRKSYQAALVELRSNLSSGDDLFLAAMTRVEETGSAEDLEKLPVWHQASSRRLGIRRDAAWKRISEVLDLAEAELAEGSWRQAAALLSEYGSLSVVYGIPPEISGMRERVGKMETALEQHRSDAERLAKARHLVAEMERIADDVETRMVTPLGLSPDFAGPLAEDLSRKIRQLESLRGDFPENSQRRVASVRAQLNQALERSNRSKRLKLVMTLGLAALILISSAILGTLVFRAAGQADLLAKLRGEQSSSGLRELVKKVRNEEPLLLKYPRLATEVAQASSWLKAMDSKLALVDQELVTMESARHTAFESLSSADLFGKLQETGAMAAELPTDLATEATARLTVLRNDGERVLMARQAANDKLARQATEKWNGVLEGIDLSGPAGVAHELLLPANTELAPFVDAPSSEHALLRLPASTETLVKDVEARILEMRERAKAVSDAVAKLVAADTGSAYREAITVLSSCGFSEAATAQRIADAWPDDDRVKAMLVFRGDLVALKAASNDDGFSSPIPDVATERDQNVIVELTSSETLIELWDVVWKDSKGVTKKWLSKGKLKEDATRGWQGEMAELPRLASMPPIFRVQAILPSRGNTLISNTPTPTTAMMSDLGLDALLDNSGTKFKSSVLPLLDAVANNEKAKPLAKAYVFKNLLRIVNNHKPEEWGLYYCPQLIDDIKAFEELEMKAPVLERQWLLESAPEGAKQWEEFFETRGKRFTYGQFLAARSAAAEVIGSQVSLAGHVTTDGAIALLPATGKRLVLGVCAAGDGIQELRVCGMVDGPDGSMIAHIDLLPLSPLLSVELTEKAQTFILSLHGKGESVVSEPTKR
jgi:hypothetical protein